MQLLLASLLAVHAVLLRGQADAAENPIRRIVTLLQKMQTEIDAEQKRDEDLNEHFVCYCTTNDGELSESTKALRDRIPELESDITEAVAFKAQLKSELEAHQQDRQEAKDAILDACKEVVSRRMNLSAQPAGRWVPKPLDEVLLDARSSLPFRRGGPPPDPPASSFVSVTLNPLQPTS